MWAHQVQERNICHCRVVGEKHFHSGYFYQLREEKISYRTAGRVSELCCLTYRVYHLAVSLQSLYDLQNVEKVELSDELRQVVTVAWGSA